LKCFARYAYARYSTYQRDQAYRFYITDELYFNARNQMHTTRFSEIFKPVRKDTRTAEEIIADIVSRAGLEIVNDELV
jgi:hypothetical protein